MCLLPRHQRLLYQSRMYSELHDYQGDNHSFLNIVCLSARYQVIGYLGMLNGLPKSSACLHILNTQWISSAGWPKYLVADRGLHNRGELSRT